MTQMRIRVGQALLALLLMAALLSAVAQQRNPEYRLGLGDTIRINVFQNPDLTLETRITENGTISYPLVGQLKVGGMTIPAAEQEIAKALRDGGFIQSPQVSILLIQNRGNQVTVLGAVGKPGRYPLDTFNIRFSEMVAIAGGILPDGSDVATISGQHDGRLYRKQIDMDDLFANDKPQEDPLIHPGDTIYVPRQPLFYIYGEAQKPGAYRVERNMTIRQALVTGGGPTTRGTERGLRVYRRGSDGNVVATTPDLDAPVLPQDVLYVGESFF